MSNKNKILTGRPHVAVFFIITILIGLIFLRPEKTLALADDYDTNIFNVEVNVDKNHVFHVKERIDVDFNKAPHRGILRYIPYSKKAYTIENIKVKGYEYNVEDQIIEYKSNSGVKLIKIGDPEEYLHGKYSYNISYDIVGYLDDDKKNDFLAVDIFPSGWNTPIKKSKVVFTSEKELDWEKVQVFSGSYGNDKEDKVYSKSIDKEKNSITFVGKNVPKEYGITLKSTLPEGFWENPKDRSIYGYILIFILVLIPIIAFVLWFIFGRDKKIIPTVEFYPPEEITPAELGYIIDGKVDSKDLSSMIMYFAHKGYLKIEEIDKKSKKSLKFIRTDKPADGEKEFAKGMLEALFSKGNETYMDYLTESFGKKLVTAKERLISLYSGDKKGITTIYSKIARIISYVLLGLTIFSGLYLLEAKAGVFHNIFIEAGVSLLSILGVFIVCRSYDTRHSRKKISTIIGSLFGIAIFSFSAIITILICVSTDNNFMIGILIVLSAVITGFFTIFMLSQTEYNRQIMGKILGFKNFIASAEEDRIRLLSDENPEYFFNIMPYAYVLDMGPKWAKKFNNIKIGNPDWYNGNDSISAFDVMLYSSMLSSIDRGIGGAFEKASLSDIAGDVKGIVGDSFSGGGFSGGGFGGGGGGAW